MSAERQAGVGRLKKRPEFLRAARKGRKWVSPGFVLQAAKRPSTAQGALLATSANDEDAGDRRSGGENSSQVRYGLTASRKVGSAVVRNRARRRLRAAAEKVLPEEGRPGYDYVLIARAETNRVPFDRLLEDLRRGLGKVAEQREARQ